MCDIHGEYLFSTPGTPPSRKCCGVFFNPKPFFVNTGTCFTSYKEVWEKWPYTFSFLKVWLNVQSSISPGYVFEFKPITQGQFDVKFRKLRVPYLKEGPGLKSCQILCSDGTEKMIQKLKILSSFDSDYIKLQILKSCLRGRTLRR